VFYIVQAELFQTFGTTPLILLFLYSSTLSLVFELEIVYLPDKLLIKAESQLFLMCFRIPLIQDDYLIILA